jgi:uncharacterized membrane protein YbhN (UPF0104 family)
VLSFVTKKTIPLLALKIGAALLFLFFLRRTSDLSLENVKWTWSHAKPLFLLLSFLTAGLLLYLNILRWHHFMHAGGFPTRFSQSATTYLAGNFLGLVSPGRLAEFGRGYLYSDYPLAETARVTVADKFYFVFFSLGFGLLGLALGHSLVRPFLSAGFLALLSVLMAGLFFLCAWLIFKGQRLAFKGLFKFFPGAEPERFFLLTLTNLTYLLMILQFHFILLAFFKIKLMYAFITFSLTLLVLTFFPVSFGNLGVREACFIYFLKNLSGYPESAALNAGALVFLQNIFLPSLAGLPVVLFHKPHGKNSVSK